jgi:hypothetical protein
MMPGTTDYASIERDYLQPTATEVVALDAEWWTDERSVLRKDQQRWTAWLRSSAQGAETDETTTVEVASPWYTEAVQRIAQLSRLGDKWVDDESDPPNAIAAAGARRVLALLESMGVKPGHIGASTDEGICISFQRDVRYADVECYNSGAILAVTSTRGSRPEVWEVKPSDIELERTIERIAGFVA